jgi:hypothetical protein
MKKLTLIIVFTAFLFTGKSVAQDNSAAKNTEYCILRVYGQGWIGKYKGIFIVREDLKVEEKNFEDNSVIGIIRETMESINRLKNEGYTLVSSSTAAGGTGATMAEYVFKKQK